MNNISAIVNDYIKCYRKGAENELRWFAIQQSLSDAVSLAALAEGPSGKRLDHQRRIPGAVLKESCRRLLRTLKKLQSVNSFEDLFDIVESTIGGIHGIGELTVYDTSLRIGAKLKLEPNCIYLHAGTRIGARKLRVGTSEQTIQVDKLPRPLKRLKAREIEDVLCIYKEYFGSGEKFRFGDISRCYG